MAQTPQQRQANDRFAKRNTMKMGKPIQPVKVKTNFKSPISKFWIIALAFVLCGGFLFEVLKLFF